MQLEVAKCGLQLVLLVKLESPLMIILQLDSAITPPFSEAKFLLTARLVNSMCAAIPATAPPARATFSLKVQCLLKNDVLCYHYGQLAELCGLPHCRVSVRLVCTCLGLHP